MDKKNTTIGVLLLLAAFASYFISARYGPKPPAPLPSAPPPGQTVTAASTSTPLPAAATTQGPPSPAQPALGAAEKATLANEFVVVTFTNHGGAIDSVALKKHLAVQGQPEPYTLNSIQAAPALSLRDFPAPIATRRSPSSAKPTPRSSTARPPRPSRSRAAISWPRRRTATTTRSATRRRSAT